MELIDGFLKYLKKGYGFNPGPKMMVWLVFIVLISIAGSHLLGMYDTALDIRIKQRELNMMDEPKTLPNHNGKVSQNCDSLGRGIFNYTNHNDR
jgi:hypothetical protein